MEGVGDGVVAIASPRMTAQNAPNGQVQPLEGAMLLDGFRCIL